MVENYNYPKIVIIKNNVGNATKSNITEKRGSVSLSLACRKVAESKLCMLKSWSSFRSPSST